MTASGCHRSRRALPGVLPGGAQGCGGAVEARLRDAGRLVQAVLGLGLDVELDAEVVAQPGHLVAAGSGAAEQFLVGHRFRLGGLHGRLLFLRRLGHVQGGRIEGSAFPDHAEVVAQAADGVVRQQRLGPVEAGDGHQGQDARDQQVQGREKQRGQPRRHHRGKAHDGGHEQRDDHKAHEHHGADGQPGHNTDLDALDLELGGRQLKFVAELAGKQPVRQPRLVDQGRGGPRGRRVEPVRSGFCHGQPPSSADPGGPPHPKLPSADPPMTTGESATRDTAKPAPCRTPRGPRGEPPGGRAGGATRPGPKNVPERKESRPHWGRDSCLGSPDWTRTSNPSINSRMLCQLSYGGMKR